MATDRAQLNPQPSPVSGSKATTALAVCHIDSGDLWAGAEVNTTTLLKALSRRPELHLTVILLNEGEMARRLRSYGIQVRVIPESEFGFLAIFNQAARFLHSHPVQILHSHRYKENLLAALLARRCKIPHLVCTRHGAPEPFKGWRSMKHSAISRLDQLVARFAADRVVSLTDELKIRLSRSLPQHKLITIRTGIDTEQVRSDLSRAEAKHRLGISENAKVVGYAGRLVPVKRLDIFLHAAKQMAEANPEIVFVIAGDGPEEAGLRTLTRELDLEDRVRFLGFRSHIYDVMRAFDVFVLCSDHEGLPRSLLEALHLGVPVVARSVGGVPEVIENRVTGLLIDSAEAAAVTEACANLLADENLRKEIAAAGRHHVEQVFSISHAASGTAELYRRLRAKPARGANG